MAGTRTGPDGTVAPTTGTRTVVLAGGVGGSKLVAGLARTLAPRDLAVVVNTGDDFEHLGLWIQPDVDTVLYRLSGRHDPAHGWGRADATWEVMAAVAELDGPDWFSLGDQDLATSLVRTHLRRRGVAPATVVAHLAERLGVPVRVLPMSEDVVSTRIHTVDDEDLGFQEWFVGRGCDPAVASVVFDGGEAATPAPGVVAAIADADLVVVAPSNPYLSIDPILAVPGIRSALRGRGGPTVAVSPIVGGRALKGPAARLLADFGREVSAVGVVDHYLDREPGLLTGVVVDTVDRGRLDAVRERGLDAWATDTVMDDTATADRLARRLLSVVAPDEVAG